MLLQPGQNMHEERSWKHYALLLQYDIQTRPFLHYMTLFKQVINRYSGLCVTPTLLQFRSIAGE